MIFTLHLSKSATAAAGKLTYRLPSRQDISFFLSKSIPDISDTDQRAVDAARLRCTLVNRLVPCQFFHFPLPVSLQPPSSSPCLSPFLVFLFFVNASKGLDGSDRPGPRKPATSLQTPSAVSAPLIELLSAPFLLLFPGNQEAGARVSEKERGLRWKRASRLSDSCLLKRQRARGGGGGGGGVGGVVGWREQKESLGWEEKKRSCFPKLFIRGKNNSSGRRSTIPRHRFISYWSLSRAEPIRASLSSCRCQRNPP